jgi:hypothetical protein
MATYPHFRRGSWRGTPLLYNVVVRKGVPRDPSSFTLFGSPGGEPLVTTVVRLKEMITQVPRMSHLWGGGSPATTSTGQKEIAVEVGGPCTLSPDFILPATTPFHHFLLFFWENFTKSPELLPVLKYLPKL